MGWHPGESGAPGSRVLSAHPQGTKKGTDGRSLSCVGRDWGARVLTPAVG